MTLRYGRIHGFPYATWRPAALNLIDRRGRQELRADAYGPSPGPLAPSSGQPRVRNGSRPRAKRHVYRDERSFRSGQRRLPQILALGCRMPAAGSPRLLHWPRSSIRSGVAHRPPARVRSFPPRAASGERPRSRGNRRSSREYQTSGDVSPTRAPLKLIRDRLRNSALACGRPSSRTCR